MQVDDCFGDVDVASAFSGGFPIEAGQSVGHGTVIGRYFPDSFLYQLARIASADDNLIQHQRGGCKPDGG